MEKFQQLDEKGFVCIDEKNYPFWVALWDGEPWLFYWHPDNRWVSLKRINQTDIWQLASLAIPNEQAELYHKINQRKEGETPNVLELAHFAKNPLVKSKANISDEGAAILKAEMGGLIPSRPMSEEEESEARFRRAFVKDRSDRKQRIDNPPPGYELPTEAQQQSPVFKAIREAIKDWIVCVPAWYTGTISTLDNHAMAIMNALPVERTDESSHHYLIPPDKVGTFDEIMKKLEGGTVKEYSDEFYDLCERINDEFGEYRMH